jgi:NAD(P)-dependent dehydrogenase (short-subunit alcohol dehydrogenase family)
LGYDGPFGIESSYPEFRELDVDQAAVRAFDAAMKFLLALADSASKAAVIGLTKSLAEELATTGLLVNAITLSSPRHCAMRVSLVIGLTCRVVRRKCTGSRD